MSTWPRTRDGLQWGTALAIVAVAVDLLVAIGSTADEIQAIATSPSIGLFLTGQLVLLSIWMGFGRAPFLVRLACLAMPTLFSPILETINSFFGIPRQPEFLLNYVLIMLVVPLPCWVLRLLGSEIIQLGPRNSGDATPAMRPRRALLLVQVLAWIAALAWVVTALSMGNHSEDMLAWSALRAPIAAGAVWATLSQPGQMGRLAVYFSTVVGIGLLLALVPDEHSSLAGLLFRAILNAGVPVAVLQLFRRLGYRFVWIGWSRLSYSHGNTTPPASDIGAEAAHCEASEGPWTDSAVENSAVRPRRGGWLNEFVSAVKRLHPLAGLLLAAMVLTDGIGILVVRTLSGAAATPTSTPTPSRFAVGEVWLQMLIIGQVGLIGIWAGLGSTRALIRFPLAVGGIILVVGMMSLIRPTSPISGDWFTPFVGCGGMAATAALGLLAIRAMGLHLTLAVGGEPSGANGRRRFQFSMLQAMIAMTEVGVLAGLLKFAYQDLNPRSRSIAETIVQGAVLGILVLLAAWIALGRRWPTVRLIVAVGLLWGVIGEISNLTQVSAHETIYMFSFSAILVAMIAAPLAVFRVCGYRLERLARKREKPPTS